MNYHLNFFFVLRDFDMLLAGLVVTLKLTVLANAIGLSAGFLVALLVMSPVADRPLAGDGLRRVLPMHAGAHPDRMVLLLRPHAVQHLS